MGDAVRRLIMGITGVTIWVIGGLLTYLLSPPDPPSSNCRGFLNSGEGAICWAYTFHYFAAVTLEPTRRTPR